MTNNQVICNGWKEIAQVCGYRSVKTIKKKAKKYQMPYVRLDGRVTISLPILMKWHENIGELAKDNSDDGWIEKKLENFHNKQSR